MTRQDRTRRDKTGPSWMAYWANQGNVNCSGQCAGWSAKSRMTNKSAVKILMRTPPEIRGTSLHSRHIPFPDDTTDSLAFWPRGPHRSHCICVEAVLERRPGPLSTSHDSGEVTRNLTFRIIGTSKWSMKQGSTTPPVPGKQDKEVLFQSPVRASMVEWP
jgi:hypothetical protein